jgi:transposase
VFWIECADSFGMTQRPFKAGASRDQLSLLPPRIEDYVAADNPVRAIDAYVSALDLRGLGFRHADVGNCPGQPPYDPADLLKLYLYGYLNQVRSSRRLEREAARNLEVIWLLKGLTPGYRTIAKFRQENARALKAANREFVLLARALDLVGGALVAIDGAFFDGNAGKASIATSGKLKKQIAAIDAEIEAYARALEAGDAEDAAARSADGGGDAGGDDVGGRMKALMEQRAAKAADLARLAASGETQWSRTDADARMLSKAGQSVVGYNVQIAVDDKHKLIVASDVVNDGNDTGQLHALAAAAKEALDTDALKALADAGYYNGDELKACEEAGIEAYVPTPVRTGRLARQGRFTHEEFVFDPQAVVYRCPGGTVLKPMNGRKTIAGKLYIRYASRKSDCGACALRPQCLSRKAARRTIHRWEHEDVLARHRARMAEADEMMRRRKALAEHPFGTLKCRAGYRHFLVRGFEKVRGEWSLMALCYNFTRVLNILGFDRFIAVLAARRARRLLSRLARRLSPVISVLTMPAGRLAARLAKNPPQRRFRPAAVA